MHDSFDRMETHSNDFEFRHHLYDTIVLLGGKKEIADILKRSEDLAVTDADIDELRKYNIGLLESTKSRLANINVTAILRESA